MPFTFNQAKLNNLLKDFFATYYDKAEFEQVRLDHTNRINKIKNLILADPFTEYELTEILKLTWATKIWANTEWLAKNIIQRNGLEKLGKNFKLLLSPDISIAEKYKMFNESIQWLGAAFVTEILSHLYPTQAGIWNSKSATFLKYIDANGINTTQSINYRNFDAKDYDNLNMFLNELRKWLNKTSIFTQNNLYLKDLLELNYMIWRLYDLVPKQYKITRGKKGHEYTESKEAKEKSSYSKSHHNELRDKIAQIGQWLGFETEIEKTISAGSRVDVVWEAKIANLGRVKYVFEVQHKGSIDSLLINLLKAKKDPTVQKLIVVTDLKQIEQIRKRIADMPESFRESLKFWQDTSVEQAHSNLEELIDIIRALGLVE